MWIFGTQRQKPTPVIVGDGGQRVGKTESAEFLLLLQHLYKSGKINEYSQGKS